MNRIRSITGSILTVCLLGFGTHALAANDCQSVSIPDVLLKHAPTLADGDDSDRRSGIASPSSYMGRAMGLGGGGTSSKPAEQAESASPAPRAEPRPAHRQPEPQGTIQPISPALEPIRSAPWRALLPGSIQ